MIEKKYNNDEAFVSYELNFQKQLGTLLSRY